VNSSDQTGTDASGTLRILFFSAARKAAGVSEMTIPCLNPVKADEVWKALLQAQPDLAPLRGGVRLTRNGEFATDQTQFHPGDEVALIPPVSGG